MIIMDIFLNRLIRFHLNNTLNLRPVNITHYAVLCPQNGDRSVTIDYVTSLHAMYKAKTRGRRQAGPRPLPRTRAYTRKRQTHNTTRPAPSTGSAEAYEGFSLTHKNCSSVSALCTTVHGTKPSRSGRPAMATMSL